METLEQKKHRLAVYQAEMKRRVDGGVYDMLSRWAAKLETDITHQHNAEAATRRLLQLDMFRCEGCDD